MENFQLTYDFLRKQTTISWKEIYWGYKNKFIGWQGLLAHAEECVSTGSNNELEIELLITDKNNISEINAIAEKLADSDLNCTDEYAQKKWLYLVLKWIFDNKENYEDPLSEVEMVYEDFDYPAEIENFVKYMPVTDGYDPSSHSNTENIARLYKNWETYLTSNSYR